MTSENDEGPFRAVLELSMIVGTMSISDLRKTHRHNQRSLDRAKTVDVANIPESMREGHADQLKAFASMVEMTGTEIAKRKVQR